MISAKDNTWVVTICEVWSENFEPSYLGTITVIAATAIEAEAKAIVEARKHWKEVRRDLLIVTSIERVDVKKINFTEDAESEESEVKE